MRVNKKNMKTYKIISSFYDKEVVKKILLYYKNYNKQIHLQKIKYKILIKEIKKRSFINLI